MLAVQVVSKIFDIYVVILVLFLRVFIGADYFSMDGMEQYNICNQNLCTLGNKFGGQSYVNQQNLSQFNDVSLRSQSFGNPSDGGEGGGSMNGCLLASSANRGGQSSSAKNNMKIVVSGLDGQNASSSEIVVPRKTVDTF